MTASTRTQALALALACLMAPVAALGQTPPADTPAPVLAPVPIPLRALGQENAPTTIDIYASFVCLTCATWHTTVLPELTRQYIDTGLVRLLFHDVAVEPVAHSVRAAAIGLCAAPERFFDVAASLMSGLPAVMNSGTPATPWYDAAIAVSGRLPEEIEACAASEVTYNQISAQNAEAGRLGLPRFPAVVVNGRPLPEPTLEAIRAAMLFAPSAPDTPAATD